MKRNLLTNLEKPRPAEAKVGANRLSWMRILMGVVFSLLFINSHAQILTFEFSALAGSEASATSNYNDGNISSSSISRGSGLTASGNTGRFNAESWALTSIANALTGNDYMEFTITPNSGYQFSVSSIVIQFQRSGTGNTAIALRSSVDGYTTDLDAVKNVTDNTSTQTFTFTFSQANSSTAVTYRLYSYAEATTGTGGPGDGTGNDIVVNGVVSAASCTITRTSAAGTDAQTVNSGTPITNITYATTDATGATVTGLPTGVTGSWASNVVTISGTPTVTGTFNYTVTSTGGGCSNTTTGSITVNAVGGGGCATDLIISEYVEGSSYNKAIEIYNGTGVSVDLSNYSVNMYTNGSATPTNTLSMVGSLADGAVFVIANSSASAAILALADTTAGVSIFNGDDAVALLKSGSVIDVIGQIGFDPGTEWGSGTTSTADNTIRRQAIITNGDSNGSDVFDPSLEWDGYSIDDISGLGSHSMTCSSNTITTGTVSTPPFAVTCSTGATGTVAFTSTDLFSSNTYTAQLSNASGSFASPVNIGTLVSDANSGTISFTIPPGTPTGSGYMIRVISSNPVVIGSNSATFNVTLSGGPCSCYEIESILVDACDEGVEGENEMFRFTVGGGDLNTSDIFIDWPNNPWLGVCQNAATDSIVAGINATVTSPGQVVQPVGGVIPAGATVMFFTSTAFDFSKFDFSALNYTLYAVFQCEGNTQGHFGNHTSTGDKTLVLECGSGCHSETVTYNADSLYAGDGATVDFDVPGTPTYSDSGYCASVPIFDVLPIDLIYFKSICDGNSAVLYWSTATETNNAYFTIEAAESANADFVPVAKVNGAGNSNEVLNYSVEVESSAKYFRLKQTDYDGKYTYSDVIAVDCEGSPVQLFPTLVAEGENIIIIGEVSSIRVFDSMGREVVPEINENKVCCLEPGMYFFVINGKSNHKVVVQ